MTDILSEFGKLLMLKVRDPSIRDWDMILHGKMKDADSLRLHTQLTSLDVECVSFVEEIIPQIVDTVLHHFLWTLESSSSLEVRVIDSQSISNSLADISDGLAGELYGSKGWRAKFSKERHPRDD